MAINEAAPGDQAVVLPEMPRSTELDPMTLPFDEVTFTRGPSGER